MQMVSGATPLYTVTFRRPPALGERQPSERTVVVEASFPVSAENTFAYGLATNLVIPGNAPGEWMTKAALWPAVIEKAWAQEDGGYHQLEGGGASGAAFEAIFGVASSEEEGPSLSDPGAKDVSIDHVARGQPVSISTKGHYVAVVAADATTITFRDQSGYRAKPQPGEDVAVTKRWTWEELATTPWRGKVFVNYVITGQLP